MTKPERAAQVIAWTMVASFVLMLSAQVTTTVLAKADMAASEILLGDPARK